MSAGAPTLSVAPRFARSPTAAEQAEDRGSAGRAAAIRVLTFTALALYAVIRWATLLHPAPSWRLVGLLLLAVAITVVIPPLRAVSLPLAVAVVFVMAMVAFPIAGLPWHWFRHVRLAVSAERIGTGLQGLANVFVPYVGSSHAIRLVIVLGAAVLLLDAAIVIAYTPRSNGRTDVRRAVGALPLIALAVVPSALVRPELPYLQGLILFGLLSAFMWADRIRSGAGGTAIVIAVAAGIAGAVLAPRLDTHSPWVDYRAWAGAPARLRVDSFDWNQTYGPLHWPRSGHAVLSVQAERGDYWKAQDLDSFNGYAWQSGAGRYVAGADATAVRRWTQQVQVTIHGMRTYDVIGAGYATAPTVAGSVAGPSAGTWTSSRLLGPGSTYRITSYSPTPTAPELARAGRRYPWGQLTDYRTLGIPVARLPAGDLPQVTFGPFHSGRRPLVEDGNSAADASRLVESSPYAAAYTLARHLATQARTPFEFVAGVQRYLSAGYAYNENPPRRRYPLESFLFKDRIGYCQQFSGAMALLLRMGGLAARVSAGFTTGSADGHHRWTVSDINAHAWVEVWFPRYGWVRFDPTPAIAPARGGDTAPAFVKNLPGAGARAAIAPRRQPAAAGGSATGSRRSGGGLAVPFVAAAALALLIGTGLLVRALRRPLPAGDELVAELERALARAGRPLPESTTLASLEQRFRSSPAAAAYVRALRLARYGGGVGVPSARERRAVREQLRLGLGFSGRFRVLWALPPRLGRPRRGRGGGGGAPGSSPA